MSVSSPSQRHSGSRSESRGHNQHVLQELIGRGRRAIRTSPTSLVPFDASFSPMGPAGAVSAGEEAVASGLQAGGGAAKNCSVCMECGGADSPETCRVKTPGSQRGTLTLRGPSATSRGGVEGI
eukprot:8528095-Pyramimonas_sp.AAC.1